MALRSKSSLHGNLVGLLLQSANWKVREHFTRWQSICKVEFHLSVGNNDGDHPARAVDSTQVKTADRGLGVHRMVIWDFRRDLRVLQVGNEHRLVVYGSRLARG